MEEAKVNGKKVIVDVDRLIAFCTRHKQGAAPLMVNSHAIELLTSGEDFEGEVLTTPVNATVIRAEFYQKGKTASLTAKLPPRHISRRHETKKRTTK